jgi:hypothetical protein
MRHMNCINPQQRPGHLVGVSPMMIGRTQGQMSRVAPVICNDMRFCDPFLQMVSENWLFIIASFPLNGEPLVHGIGAATAEKTWELSRYMHRLHNAEIPSDAVICARQPGRMPIWKSARGQTVTFEHITVRKVISQ